MSDVIHGRAKRSSPAQRRPGVDNSAGRKPAGVEKLSPTPARRGRPGSIGCAGANYTAVSAAPRSRSRAPELRKLGGRLPDRGVAPVQKFKRTPPSQGPCIRSTGNRRRAPADEPAPQERVPMQTPSVPSAPAPAGDFAALGHFAGFDWAKDKHHVAVVDPSGRRVLELGIEDTAEGWAALRQKLAAFPRLAVAIETSCGPAVERLLEMGLAVYPLNPMAAQRYRDRKSPAGAKDDALDAWSFADALRTDGHGWRRL